MLIFILVIVVVKSEFAAKLYVFVLGPVRRRLID